MEWDRLHEKLDRLLAELFRWLQRASECKTPAAERLPTTPAISPMQPCPLNEVPLHAASPDCQRASAPKAQSSPELAQTTCPKVPEPLVLRPKSLEPPSKTGPPISQLTNRNITCVESQVWLSETILNREPPKGSSQALSPLAKLPCPLFSNA